MEIIVGKNAGFCFGVERAVEIIRKALKKINDDVYSLGPIIHNPQTNEMFEEMGLKMVDSIDEIEKGSLVIRSHGLEPEIIKTAESKGIRIIDATCPLVKKVQDYAELLYKEGYKLFILGDPLHPEIRAVAGFTDNSANVIENENDLKDNIRGCRKVGVVIQTTQILDNYKNVIYKLIKNCDEFRIYNTICDATHERQEETVELARKSDLIIIVGGKNSANTTRLKKVAESIGCVACHIESPDELEKNWFHSVKVVSIVGGASTPEWIVNDTVLRIKEFK